MSAGWIALVVVLWAVVAVLVVYVAGLMRRVGQLERDRIEHDRQGHELPKASVSVGGGAAEPVEG